MTALGDGGCERDVVRSCECVKLNSSIHSPCGRSARLCIMYCMVCWFIEGWLGRTVSQEFEPWLLHAAGSSGMGGGELSNSVLSLVETCQSLYSRVWEISVSEFGEVCLGVVMRVLTCLSMTFPREVVLRRQGKVGRRQIETRGDM
ncbi:hypothetical protein CBL_13407 [Carabus blaptoides fortunei]